MTNQEINIIVKALKEENAKTELIKFIEESSDKNIIDILCFHENLINILPRQIISMYEEEIILNADLILEKVIIKDTKLLDIILKRAKVSFNTIELMLEKYDNAEELNSKFPYIFSEYKVLNYSKSKLSTHYINSCSPSSIGEGFLRNQTITSVILAKAVENHNIDIFKQIEKISKKKKVELSEDVLLYFWRRFDVHFLLEHYSIPKKLLRTIVYEISNNDSDVINLLKNSDLSTHFIEKFVPDRYLQYYFAYNKFLKENILIQFYKKSSNINWTYVNRYVNLSKFINYTEILFKEGYVDTIEQNLIYHSKVKNKIYNISSLRKLGIDLSCIENYINNALFGLSSTIHNL